ncbi:MULTISPECIES: ThiF family adenylyltransferase, partial [Streptomyces]|uniref:ThiF family adenylyltransferase n=1 Tax=Streptomyces TaxID=1883 RepID=UPI0004CC1A66
MERPRIKRSRAPYRTDDRAAVRLGGLYGRAYELPDPSGTLWRLLSAMDGTRTLHELAAHVRQVFPTVRLDDVVTAVEQLQEHGLLVDAAEGAPADFTPAERTLYDKGRQLLEWADTQPRTSAWETQRLLRAARVTLVGLGGTGCAAATALAASGVGRLRLIDPDTVEAGNLGRQLLYRPADVGWPKADAAVVRLEEINPHISLTGCVRALTTREEFVDALDGCDLLVVCADQPEGLQAKVNLAALDTGTAWVDSGYHGPQIAAALYVPGSGPCWSCLRYADAGRLQLPREEEAFLRALPKVPGNPASPVTAGMSGNWAAHLAIAHLTGAFPYAPGTPYGTRLLQPEAPLHVTYPRQDACPACSRPGVGVS